MPTTPFGLSSSGFFVPASPYSAHRFKPHERLIIVSRKRDVLTVVNGRQARSSRRSLARRHGLFVRDLRLGVTTHKPVDPLCECRIIWGIVIVPCASRAIFRKKVVISEVRGNRKNIRGNRVARPRPSAGGTLRRWRVRTCSHLSAPW